MSIHRDRRRIRRGDVPGCRARSACAVLLALLVTTCGSDNGDATPDLPGGIVLPRVGTLGRAPKGESAIVVTVTAEGRMTIDGKGPLSLIGLREELQRRTADAKWREPDMSSKKILLVNADATLPWPVVTWIWQVACGPRIGLYKTFIGAAAGDGSGVGALGWTLPKDGSMMGLPDPWQDPPPMLWLKVRAHDGPSSPPSAVIPELRRVAGDAPMRNVRLTIHMPTAGSGSVPTGFVVEVVDMAIRAGVRSIRFGGMPLHPEFEPDDVEGLLAQVAKMRANLGSPYLRVEDRTLDGRLPDETLPTSRGRLSALYGLGVETREPRPVGDEEGDEEAPIAVDFDLPNDEPPDPWHGIIMDPGPEAFPFPLRRRGRSDPVEAALKWLKDHQAPNGGWEASTFGRWCRGKEVPSAANRPDGGGDARCDVEVTGLAVCAFLGAAYTNRGRHAYAKTVSKGLRYLKNVQDAEGCYGSRTHERWIYGHAAAAQAMVEAYGMTGSPIFKGSAQRALDFIASLRTPGAGWRYGVEPGDDDVSVTAWMALPLYVAKVINDHAAERGRRPKLRYDEMALPAALVWIRGKTDPAPGALLLRILLGESPEESPTLARGISHLAEHPPRWDVAAGTIDPRYWYLGTMAAFQVGGSSWKAWKEELKQAVRETQRTDTDPCHYQGSWDPAGPGDEQGGRVASTALLCMCLEVRDRYGRIGDAR